MATAPTRTTAPAVRGRVLRGAGALNGLAGEWDELYARCRAATPFQSHCWLWSWSRAYRAEGRVRLALACRGDRLVGAAPFLLEHRMGCRVLTPLGRGHSDFTDVLIGPDEHPADEYASDERPTDGYLADEHLADEYGAGAHRAGTPHADAHRAWGDRAGGHRGGEHGAGEHRGGGHRPDAYRADGHRPDAYRADGHRPDAYQADGYWADAYRTDGYRADAHRTDGYRADAHRADGYRADGYGAHGHRVDAHRADAHRAAELRAGDHRAGEVAAALSLALLAEPGWDVIDLPEVRPGAAADHLMECWPGRAWTLPASTCLELPALPVDDVVARLAPRRAGKLRRSLRRIEAKGVEVTRVAAPDARRAMDALLRLHLAQWEGRGINREHLRPEFAAHLTRAAARLVEAGQGALTEFRIGGRLLACDFALIGSDFVGGYLYGAHPDLRAEVDVLALLVRNGLELARELGRPTLSLLRGAEPYKDKWAGEPVPNRRLILGRGARAVAYAAAVRARLAAEREAARRCPSLADRLRTWTARR
ncbi:GNAT family N-acetyltransferase [Thermocatellispora tengchongensis]|nr:GNAT family N-acetyltransferase [Thermocatellispora tengchongensis]